jgi:mannose-6-phosphate isomerase-like protein (cupin superfamily)
MKRLLLIAISIATAVGATTIVRSECLSHGLSLARDTTVIEMHRVYSAADARSYAETIELQGSQTTYLGAVLTQFGLGDPSNVVIVHGPPNFEMPAHPAPYREIFLILSGSATVVLSGGQEIELKPGSLILFEDTTGLGHSGRFGPCGYVALDLQFKPVEPSESVAAAE